MAKTSKAGGKGKSGNTGNAGQTKKAGKAKRRFKIGLMSIGALVLVIIGLYFLLYKDYPYYKKMEQVRITSFTKDNITVKANVVCHNPNGVEVRLAGCDFKVKANGKHVSDVDQRFTTTVGAESDFTVPLTVSFSPRKIFKPKDLLGMAFISLKSKQLHMDYEGTVEVGLAGEDISIPVEYSEDIAFKK